MSQAFAARLDRLAQDVRAGKDLPCRPDPKHNVVCFVRLRLNPAFAKRKGISRSVAHDFNVSDPGGKLPKLPAVQEAAQVTIPEQSAGVAISAIEALKNSPALLALIMLQLATMGMIYFSVQAQQQRMQEREMMLIEACGDKE